MKPECRSRLSILYLDNRQDPGPTGVSDVVIDILRSSRLNLRLVPTDNFQTKLTIFTNETSIIETDLIPAV